LLLLLAVISGPHAAGAAETSTQHWSLCPRRRPVVPEFQEPAAQQRVGNPIDAFLDIEENHLRMAGQTDRPIAGLLTDLKRRGLLESTLALWGGEFGRSPEAQGNKGRDHHNLGFSMWLAGGGIQGGTAVGATDAIGLHAVDNCYHLRDVHTTILHQLGLDQDELSHWHLGRKERLTLVEGKVIQEIV
jgi:hypothetical protein